MHSDYIAAMYLTAYPSVYLSIYLSIYLYIYIYIYISFFQHKIAQLDWRVNISSMLIDALPECSIG